MDLTSFGPDNILLNKTNFSMKAGRSFCFVPLFFKTQVAENLAESMMNLATSDMSLASPPVVLDLGNLGNNNLPTEPVVLVRKISDDTSGDNEDLGHADENKGTQFEIPW